MRAISFLLRFLFTAVYQAISFAQNNVSIRKKLRGRSVYVRDGRRAEAGWRRDGKKRQVAPTFHRERHFIKGEGSYVKSMISNLAVGSEACY